MNCTIGRWSALIGAVALGASAAAWADNPLGLYVGFGAGIGNVQNDHVDYNPFAFPGTYHDHDAAWKVLGGLRPISLVGAELEYIDFGNAGGNSGLYGDAYLTSVSAHPKAAVLYALGYLPLPLPFIDVYGKLGVARLETNNTYLTACAAAATGDTSCPVTQSRFDQQNTKLAYGAGVQAKFQDFAFRGEYERISSTYGDPSALMVSVTWTF